jgi:hypothetical protein
MFIHLCKNMQSVDGLLAKGGLSMENNRRVVFLFAKE